MVKEGLALEALPWEAKALDGLELPVTSSVMVLWNEDGWNVAKQNSCVASVK